MIKNIIIVWKYLKEKCAQSLEFEKYVHEKNMA